jgi:large subunit ribosomal protein L9
MKVLLCEDIKKLGYVGDVVDVSDGYARNYLLPQGLGKPATQNNLRAIAKEKAVRAEERIKERSRLEQAAKANEQGVLFGSITEKDIAANLRDQGFQTADEVVQLPAHIKNTGTHKVELRFADDLKVMVSVVVVAEQAEHAEHAEQPAPAPSAEQDQPVQ